MSNIFQRNYKALIIGGFITLVMSVALTKVGFVIINPIYVTPIAYIIINTLGFILCWLLLSFLIYKYPIYKVLGIVSLLIAVMVIETYAQVPDNPITFPLLILFWLGLAYLISPQFFKKYRVAILSVYGAALAYFFIFRMMPNYAEEYRRNFLSLLIIPIPVFAALWSYEQWRWRKTLEADKGKAELALLKSQINPHFFFNTLNNLYGLVVERSEKAPEVILKLSDMMRYTIYEGKEDFVPLEDEIAYLNNYIELHKIRYQKKVEILFTHDIKADLSVAPLLFIILLENAFKHGVDKMRDNAFIHLRIQSRGKQLYFMIQNNFDKTSPNQNKGIGLENLRKRLEYLYPDRHDLLIDKGEAIYKVQLNLELI